MTSGTTVESTKKENENMASKLGKISIFRKSQVYVEVVATDLNEDAFSKSSVKCFLISKDCKLSVTVPEELLGDDPVYLKIMEDMNKTFLKKYDLKALDNVNKCQYLDGPDGNTRPEITGFVLEAKISDITESDVYDDVTNKRAVTSRKYCQFKPPSEEDLYLLPVDDHGIANVYEIIDDNDIYDLVTSIKNQEIPKSHTMFAPQDNKRGLRKKAKSVDNILLEADTQGIEKTKPSALFDGLHICGEKLVNFPTAFRFTQKRGSDISTATKYSGPSGEISHGTSRSMHGVRDHSQGKIRQSNRSAVHLRPGGDDRFGKFDESNLRKAISLNSLSEPSREVTNRWDDDDHVYETMNIPASFRNSNKPPIPDENEHLYETINSPANRRSSNKPPNPDKQAVLQKLKADGISVKSLEASHVKCRSMPTRKGRSTQRPKEEIKIIPESTETKRENNAGHIKKDQSSHRAKAGIPCLESPSSAFIPEDLSRLTVTGVGRLLTSLHMQCYVNKFHEEQIDGEILVTLDKTALFSLDLNAFHVAKLTRIIEGWRPNIENNAIS